MRLMRQDTRWSCVAFSFAMAFDIDIKVFYNLLGHDGSEILFSDLPEPYCRRSFHPQEFFWVGRKLGYHVITVELTPILSPDNNIEWPVPIKCLDFVQLLHNNIGVFTGSGVRTRHAVAWNGQKIYDPNGMIYEFAHPNFTPEVFYLILKS